MKELRKKICLLLAVSMLVCMDDIPVLATTIQGEDVIIGQTNDVTPDEPSGFDENAHGEVIKKGNCGAEYKLYEDKTLYIYGNNEIKTVYLGNYSYFFNEDVSGVYIEEGVTGIGEKAFYECKDIDEVRIPESVKKIGNHAFAYCESLKTINLPDGIEDIEKNAFFSCKSLREIQIPNKIGTICEETFSCCDNLTSVTLPEELKSIEKGAFSLTNLTKLTLPDSLNTIGESAFYFCDFESLVIPNSVTLIDSNAFDNCNKLESVLIPDNVTKIRNGAFSNCVIYCNENSEAERYAKENGITHKPISMWESGEPNSPDNPTKPEGSEVPIKNTFNGCKGNPVKLSITCKESDEFTFECTGNCGIQSQYAGYSSIQVGGFSSYSKNYELTFTKSGEHIIAAYKNGSLMEYDKIVIAEEHTWDSGKVDKIETCTKNGIKKFTCLNCENTKTEPIPATGHSYIGKVTQKENCVRNGAKTFTCSKCGNTYTESIPATGHNYLKPVTRKATCEENGTETYTCSKCGVPYTKVIPKTGHKYGNWMVTVKATVLKKGKEKISCTICGKTLQERDIKKLKANVKISKTKLKLKKGKKYQLKIKKKSNGDKVSKWTTSNKRIVSVNKKTGKIKALKKGKAKITVRMKSGCKATCNVTVK